jgi:hypothetical protein
VFSLRKICTFSVRKRPLPLNAKLCSRAT